MYEQLKFLVKKALPATLLQRNDVLIRRLLSIAYVGRRHACNVCTFKMSRFIRLQNGDLLCPRCGSLPRARRLLQIITDDLTIHTGRVLHFSPPAALSVVLRQRFGEDYVTTDYAGEFDADKHLDITDTGEKSETYDLIICYHVLEHIDQDRAAMAELYRMLKPGSRCLIQTPFKDGDIYEDEAVVTPEDRLQHFGQADHVRVYSVTGLSTRLTSSGFIVERLDYQASKDNYNGYKPQEAVLVAKKG